MLTGARGRSTKDTAALWPKLAKLVVANRTTLVSYELISFHFLSRKILFTDMRVSKLPNLFAMQALLAI